MRATKSIWLDAVDWLKRVDPQLPALFPSALPPETAPDFWFRLAETEMKTRDVVSAKVRAVIDGKTPSSLTSLEAFIYRRRVEWAAQLALAKAQEGIEPNAPLTEVLIWLLVASWESDGCIALWNHAERGGKPHPKNPRGLSPI